MENENAFDLSSQEQAEHAIGLHAAVEESAINPADQAMEMPPDSDEMDDKTMRAAAETRQAQAIVDANMRGDEERADRILEALKVDDEPIALPDDSE